MSGAGDLEWHVSRTCDTGACVKVARKGAVVVIGTTNNPDGPFNEFTVVEWRQFLAGVKLGDFDEIA
jgi:predicted secreted Zn-dependent protease